MKEEPIPLLNPFQKAKKFFETFEFNSSDHPQHQQFHINRLEGVINQLHFPFPPHRQPMFDFIFLSNGTSVRSKGLDKYECGANSFFFLPAYQISTHDFMSSDAEGFYCHFDLEIFNRKCIGAEFIGDLAFLQFTGNPLITISNTAKGYVLNMLNRLEAEYINNAKVDLDIIVVNLLAIFLEVKQFVRTEKITENSAFRITQQYKNKLSNHIYEKQSVAQYADMLAVSPNHLNKCVKAATGKSAQELLSEMLLLEAKVLLKQTHLTVNEIAWKAGREDLSDFIRFFKTKTGLTPTEYRKMD